MGYELLGMPTAFLRKTCENFSFLDISRYKRLNLTCFVELGNWGFFGGSIEKV
jgi:hypothetical protein